MLPYRKDRLDPGDKELHEHEKEEQTRYLAGGERKPALALEVSRGVRSDRGETDETRALSPNAGATVSIAEPSRPLVQYGEEADSGTAGHAATKPISLQLGMVLNDRFVLEQELGHGGMSTVYRARDLNFSGRDAQAYPYVAIKVLGGDFGRQPDAWKALQDEVQKARSLGHQRIVTMHDFDFDRSTGVPYAQMEELHGESLDELIARHPAGLGDASLIEKIVLSIADGLSYAHKHGVVHADLKPSNVFMTESGEIKILDFGISRLIREDVADFFSEHEITALSPMYASPEMCDQQRPQPADDVFALGIIAVELYSGAHPFIERHRDVKDARQAQQARIRIPRPSTVRSKRQWRAISASLSYDRAERPMDGGEFIRRYRRKSQSIAVVTATASVAVIAISVWAFYFQKPRPEIPFDELPAVTQIEILDALQNGREALAMRDLNGALLFFSRAFELQAFNPEAIEGLEEVVGRVLRQPDVVAKSDVERRIAQIEVLLEYPALADSRRLHRRLKRLREALHASSGID